MERLEIIETLKHLPNMIETEIDGLSEVTLRQRSSEGEWSIKEVIGHLRDHTAIWRKRFFMVWSLQDPVLPGYNAEAAVQEGNYQEREVQSIIDGLRGDRLESVRLLSEAVDWTRLGQMPGEGRRSLKQLAEGAIAHEHAHLQQIRATKAALGISATA